MKTLSHTVLSALTLALIVAGPTHALAQSTGEASRTLTAGEELLVTYDTGDFGSFSQSYRRTVRAEFVDMDGGRMLVRVRDQLLLIDTRSIRSVRRRIGTKPASAPAMALGSAAGFGAAFLIGVAMYDDGGPGSTSSATNSGLAAGVLIGAPVGALVAWMVSRSRPLYESVDIGGARPRVVIRRSGGVSFSFSLPTR